MKIYNKENNARLYGSGFYGNRLRQWLNVKDLLRADPRPHLIMLRQAAAQGGGICVDSLDVDEAVFWHGRFELQGHSQLYFSEQIQHQPENILFQGEYVIESHGEYLRCSDVKAFHREAMIESEAFNLACRPVLYDNMDLRSCEAVIEIAEAFPAHVVEFTLCNEPIGMDKVPLIIWEVRWY